MKIKQGMYSSVTLKMPIKRCDKAIVIYPKSSNVRRPNRPIGNTLSDAKTRLTIPIM